MGAVGQRLILAAILLCIVLTAQSIGKMEYDIMASVDSSGWHIHRSTQALNYSVNGSVNGNGSFLKYVKIQEFAGIEASELSSSMSGNLSYDEQMLLLSREGPVVVLTKLQSGTNESTNESQIVINESAEIEIDEKWPTYLANYKKISYFGPGIHSTERYRNNGDTVYTQIDSWKLLKESLYRGYLNRTLIKVNITPTGVVEDRDANKTSFYALNLDSIGSSASLDISRQSPGDDFVARIMQDYKGEVHTTLKVDMNESVLREFPEPEPEGWLECCFSSEAERKAYPWMPEY